MVAQLHFGTGDSASSGTTGAGTASVVSIAKTSLSNVVVGDLLVAWIHGQNATAGTITVPNIGWTQYGAAIGSPTAGATRNSQLFYYRVRSQADIDALPPTLTWTFSQGGSRAGGIVARASGIDLDDPEDAEAATFSTTSNASSLAVTGVTTVSATALLVGVYHRQNAAGASPTTSSWLTEFEEYRTSADGVGVSSSGIGLAYEYLTSAGATGNKTVTIGANASVLSGQLVSFKATDDWPTADRVAAKYTSAVDTLADASVQYTSATDTLATPAEIRHMAEGHATVAAMLATEPFYVGHRGGSANWPEMSLHAYTQAAFWGVGALEISLARTDDGVWFGLHDEDLDRTSGTTGFVVGEHTWAEVQAYEISAADTTNPGQAAQPYMRWEELIEAYGSTHVLLVDPKTQTSVAAVAELLDLMDAVPNSIDCLIAKYYGVTTYWPAQASARGYTTWGYFYHTDEADFEEYEGRWDILGLNYDADQAVWTTMLGFGKPVIAHLIDTHIAGTTALAKGADGLMVSGVQQVISRES